MKNLLKKVNLNLLLKIKKCYKNFIYSICIAFWQDMYILALNINEFDIA